MDKCDNLQSPPWSSNDGNAKKLGEDQKEVKHWGPILTFAIPCQDDESKESTAKDKCQPLLWKVHHPPNPNVALDSFLLIDRAMFYSVHCVVLHCIVSCRFWLSMAAPSLTQQHADGSGLSF